MVIRKSGSAIRSDAEATLTPAATFACSMALSTPAVTGVGVGPSRLPCRTASSCRFSCRRVSPSRFSTQQWSPIFDVFDREGVKFEEIIRALNTIGYAGPLSVEWEDNAMDRAAEVRPAGTGR